MIPGIISRAIYLCLTLYHPYVLHLLLHLISIVAIKARTIGISVCRAFGSFRDATPKAAHRFEWFLLANYLGSPEFPQALDPKP